MLVLTEGPRPGPSGDGPQQDVGEEVGRPAWLSWHELREDGPGCPPTEPAACPALPFPFGGQCVGRAGEGL